MKKAISTAAERVIPGGFSVLLAFVLLLGSTAAYFTDKTVFFAVGNAGDLGIHMENPPSGKRAFAYDVMNDLSLAIRNTGNKSMDVRVNLWIESNLPISDGISAGTTTLPLLRLFEAENPEYEYHYDPDTGIFTETADPAFLSGTLATDTGESEEGEETQTLEFVFTGLLNGTSGASSSSGTPRDYEIESGGLNSFDLPLQCFLPQYRTIAMWESLTDNAWYRITIRVYGKQHRNSSDADWQLLGVY